MIDYSPEQKGYKCYNPRTKQVQVSRDVVFDESASCYALPTPSPDSIPITEDEASEPETIWEEEEEEEGVGTLEESPTSFRIRGPNERLSRNDQTDEEPTSCGDLVVQSPRPKPRTWLTRKEKGKKKMLEFGFYRE